MSEAKFTPGPWAIGERSRFGDIHICQEGDRADHWFAYASSRMSSIQSHWPAEANARLIVAAPLLLKALERLLGKFDMAKSNYGFVTRDDIAEAEAAIAAAYGENYD